MKQELPRAERARAGRLRFRPKPRDSDPNTFEQMGREFGPKN